MADTKSDEFGGWLNVTQRRMRAAVVVELRLPIVRDGGRSYALESQAVTEAGEHVTVSTEAVKNLINCGPLMVLIHEQIRTDRGTLLTLSEFEKWYEAATPEGAS